MTRPVNIDIKTTADIAGAQQTKAALDQVKQSATGAGSAGSQAGAAMESGIGAMAGKLLTVAAAWLGVRKAIGDVTEAMRLAGEQEALDASQDAIIKATGASAGQTATQLNSMRDALSEMSGAADESIERAQNLMLTFTQIRDKKVFEDAMKSVNDMAAVFGGDASQAAVQLGKALNDPIVGLTALRRIGVSFSEDQTRMITQLARSGDLLTAQTEILAELKREFGGAAEAAGTTLAGALQRARNASNDAKQAFGSWFGELLSGTGITDAYTSAMRSLEAAFQSTGSVADQLKLSLPDLADTDLSAIANDAGSLARSLEDANDATKTMLDRMAELEQAKLARDVAEVKRDVATGRLSPEEGRTRIASLQGSSDARMVDAERKAISDRRAALQGSIAGAEASQSSAMGRSVGPYNELVMALGELAKQFGLSESEQNVLSSGSGRGANAVLRARASQADSDLQRAEERRGLYGEEAQYESVKARVEAEKQALTQLQELIAAYNSARAAAAAQAETTAKTKAAAEAELAAISHREQILDFTSQTSAIGVETVAAETSASTANRDRRAKARALREQIRLAETRKRELPGELIPGVKREQSEADAAEAAFAAAQSSGRVDGMSTRGATGRAALEELRAKAQRERGEADRAAINAGNAIQGIARTILDLSARLQEVEAQIKNGPS